MKIVKRLVFLHLLMTGLLSNAQPVIYNGDILLTSQAEVDSFPINYPEVTHVLGNMLIGSFGTIHTDIARLDSLNNLQVVSGSLYIIRNGSLKNLEGLIHLDTVSGTLRLQLNDSLEVTAGLESLKTFTGLEIIENERLTAISGFESLKKVAWYIRIEANDNLETVSDFSALDSLEYFTSINNPRLKAIGSFPKLRWASGFNIEQNDSLESVGDFPVLGANDTVWLEYPFYLTDFNVINNPRFMGIGQLPNLQFAGGFHVEACPMLKDLSGFSNLVGLTSIFIKSTGLDSLPFAQLDTIRSSFELLDNDSLISISALQNLHGVISGEFKIEDNDRLLNLDGLENVTITGELVVRNNAALEDLDGLQGLKLVRFDEAVIAYNHALKSCNGLRNLEVVDTLSDGHKRDFAIVWNQNLQQMDSAFHLKKVSGYVGIGYDSLLEVLDNFNEFEECAGVNVFSIGGKLHTIRGFQMLDSIQNGFNVFDRAVTITCDSLRHLEAFPNLRYATQSILISHSSVLDTIEGFHDLRRNEHSILLDNLPALRSIDFLSNVEHVGDSIHLYNNPLLADCSALCAIMEHGHVGKGIKLHNNAFPCNDLDDVQAWCDTMTLSLEGGPASAAQPMPTLRLAPNPAALSVSVQVPPGISLPCRVELSDSAGRLLYSGESATESYLLTLQGFAAGWYLVRARDGQGRSAASVLVVGD